MKIIEPKKRICIKCNKTIKKEKNGFGIPVFKGTYFKREWTCTECMGEEFLEAYSKKVMPQLAEITALGFKSPYKRGDVISIEDSIGEITLTGKYKIEHVRRKRGSNEFRLELKKIRGKNERRYKSEK